MEMIETLRLDGRKGERLPKDQYEFWSSFTLSILDSHDKLTLNELLDKANHNVTGAPNTKIAWYVLHVKRDLQAKALIKAIPVPKQKHTFFLKLTRKGKAQIHFETQLLEWLESDR